MRRLAAVAGALAAMAVWTPGCGPWSPPEFEAWQYTLEVTGTAATSISFSSPSRDPSRDINQFSGMGDLPDTTLPFKRDGIAIVEKTGPLTLRLTPKDGAATCRIVVEGKEAVTKSGPAGTELVCTTTLKGVD